MKLYTKKQMDHVINDMFKGRVYKEEIEGLLTAVADVLCSGDAVGITWSGYGYYPTNKQLTRWRTSDGGTLEDTLLGIMVDYAGLGEHELGTDPWDVVDEPWMAKNRRDQAGLELDQLMGDSIEKAIDMVEAEWLNHARSC